MDKRHLYDQKVPSLRHQKSYVKLAKALGYSEEIVQLLEEPKYDTMEELLEINKNRKRKRGL
jgi:hypothetical protein